MKKIALIPAYEPDMKMVSLADTLHCQGYEVVIVNDGSESSYDGVFELAKRKDTTVISYQKNRGKGNALKTGLSYICMNYKEPYVVVTVDADGQHRPEDIDRVVSESMSEPDSLIIGGRRFEGRVPLRSRIGNTITRFVYRASSGTDVFDTQTGLRAFTDRLINVMIDIPGERYEYEMNVLMHFAGEELSIKEIPIETVYLDENSSSHFDTIRDSIRIYKEILKFSGVSFASFLVDYGLYSVFMSVTGVLTFSNIFARILSAVFNYTMNKKLVFKSNVSIKKSLTQYIALAVFILACNTAILGGLAYAGLNVFVGKIITEIIMFFVSYTIQHKFVFKKSTSASKKVLPGKVAV